MARPVTLFESNIRRLSMNGFNQKVTAKHLDGSTSRIGHEGFGPACYDRVGAWPYRIYE